MAELLVNNKIVVRDKKLKDQLIQKGFGENTGKEFVLDLKESLYLMDREKLELENVEGNPVSQEELLKTGAKLEKGFFSTYVVYRDLRERGFVVKTGYKFGFDLRVYPRGKKPGEDHTQWVVNVVTQDEKFSIPEMSRMVRLSGNLKTMLLQAVVDSENDINYYEIKRITP